MTATKPKKRNPVARKLADPRFRQRVVPAKRRPYEGRAKPMQDYRRTVDGLKDPD
jgi:hypothetical protein